MVQRPSREQSWIICGVNKRVRLLWSHRLTAQRSTSEFDFCIATRSRSTNKILEALLKIRRSTWQITVANTIQCQRRAVGLLPSSSTAALHDWRAPMPPADLRPDNLPYKSELPASAQPVAVAIDCSLRISLALILVLLCVAVFKASRFLTCFNRFPDEQQEIRPHSLVAPVCVCAIRGEVWGGGHGHARRHRGLVVTG